MCAGMSSGPSIVCVQYGASSGTASSNQDSKSRAHVGRGVLVERQRRRGVADEQVQQADAHVAAARAAPSLDLARDEVEAARPRARA